ncbi:MAG: hypothetical protein FWH23_03370 [Bacteroidales bacterium]|nr:hypothetical protein [Bacteroidales bacterium]MCL2132720.1 hypothetical protein [Bacteroidales bacterium]
MQTFIIMLLIAIALVGFSVLALSISILIRKKGKFPETEVGKNSNMRRLGIRCTKQEEIIRWRQLRGEAVNPEDICSGCSGEECTEGQKE